MNAEIAVIDAGPSEQSWWEPPQGYDAHWEPDNPNHYRAATVEEHDLRVCRRPRCKGKPVFALKRGKHWWLYCEEHMYGHRIRDGKSEARRGVRRP